MADHALPSGRADRGLCAPSQREAYAGRSIEVDGPPTSKARPRTIYAGDRHPPNSHRRSAAAARNPMPARRGHPGGHRGTDGAGRPARRGRVGDQPPRDDGAGRRARGRGGRLLLGDDLRGRSLVVAVGPGNNGGGALAAARHLANRGARVHVVLARPALRIGTSSSRAASTPTSIARAASRHERDDGGDDRAEHHGEDLVDHQADATSAQQRGARHERGLAKADGADHAQWHEEGVVPPHLAALLSGDAPHARIQRSGVITARHYLVGAVLGALVVAGALLVATVDLPPLTGNLPSPGRLAICRSTSSTASWLLGG